MSEFFCDASGRIIGSLFDCVALQSTQEFWEISSTFRSLELNSCDFEILSTVHGEAEADLILIACPLFKPNIGDVPVVGLWEVVKMEGLSLFISDTISWRTSDGAVDRARLCWVCLPLTRGCCVPLSGSCCSHLGGGDPGGMGTTVTSPDTGESVAAIAIHSVSLMWKGLVLPSRSHFRVREVSNLGDSKKICITKLSQV